MDFEKFLALERQRLQEERAQLSARSIEVASARENDCPALEILKNKGIIIKCKCKHYDEKIEIEKLQRPQDNELALQHEVSDITAPTSAIFPSTSPSLMTATTATPITSRSDTFSLFTHTSPETENAAAIVGAQPQEVGCVGANSLKLDLTKLAKDLVNQKEYSATYLEELKKNGRKQNRRRSNQDDMEQWVSDTFYSYFPGFNNEYQKRQHHLRERQQEHQENFLKHQMLHPPISKYNAQKLKNAQTAEENATARSSSSTTTSHTTASHDKTDLEIIVNNPNYVPPKQSFTSRPGTTRHKLLEDLRHTELSTIVGADGIVERNRHNAELESARKKDYQRDLMQQIEEKRLSIEMLREKERRQDEALTMRLQDQLKTIQLQEQLEKEKMRADKVRFDAEQSRLMREHLLAKLEHDTKLLHAKHNSNDNKISSVEVHQEDTAPEAANVNNDKNKVYQYFSNSARHEYRRGKPLSAEFELDLEIPEAMNTERECFHLSDKVCPMCDAPLRSYESCCLRCQKKLSLKLKLTRKPEVNGNGNDNTSRKDNNGTEAFEESLDQEEDALTFSLVCVKCERLYKLCSTCVAKSDVCRACHRKRNVCMNCRRTLCTFCLEEIACGRDIERKHVNDQDNCKETIKNEAGPEKSFQVLEVNYASFKETDAGELLSNSAALRGGCVDGTNYSHPTRAINANVHEFRPPFSMNIERNSIFHPDYEPTVFQQVASFEQLPKIMDKQLSFDLDSLQTDEQKSMERVRKETDKRLSRYMRNYGDLAQHKSRSKSESRNRSTQTTPNSSARRDVVLHEEHNLSMPLLREMPKMTRKESSNFENALNNKRKIDHLRHRWEIPAVQKFTVSPTSPKVLTQVGAIRKQLQEERLLEDY